ncbi:MAG: SpoIIE family protein phosphatase [Chloroflexi bacterium]|nr:SpoIIE family protein phosphatase [Chloroflexota bacterium]
MKIRTLLPTIYTLGIGLGGIAVLVILTDWNALSANVLPLTVFVVLSFILKRAGFHAAPEVTHSLVGIIDLAAVLIFGPLLGAWVAAVSGFFYLFLNALRREKHTFRNLVEIPVFNAGLKIGMAYGSTYLYKFFGGSFPPHAVTTQMILPMFGAVLAWFLIDHIGWGLLEFLQGGAQAVVNFLRSIFFYSVLVELMPLPFSLVIADVYVDGDPGTFLAMMLGLVGTAIIVQRFADATRKLEYRSNDLAALNEFAQALANAGFDTEKIIDLLCEHSRRIVQPDLCRVELVDKGREATTIVLEATPSATMHPNQKQTDLTLVEYFSNHREPIRALDLARSFVYPFDATPLSRTIQNLVQIDGAAPRSLLILPMCVGDEVLGILSFFSARPRIFFPIHGRNLASMCGQAAVGIQNARLYSVERKRATQLATIGEVSRQVATYLDLDEVLLNVVTRIREQFAYSNVHVFTLDERAGYVIFRASTHPLSGEWRERNLQFRVGLEGIVGWVAATREPLVVPDVRKDKRFVLDPDKALIDTCSEVAVPLLYGDRVLGVLDVQSNELNAFDEDDLFVLSTLGAQVAIALEDARLFQSQREEAYYLNVLLQVAENLAATIDLEDALETIVRITTLLVGVARCVLFYYRAEDKIFVPAKQHGISREMEETYLAQKIPGENELAFDKLAREQKPLVIENASDARSILIVPLITRGTMVGAMVVDQGSRPTPFTRHEIDVVMGIANQAAAAIEAGNTKRLENELGFARQIQQSFLPEMCPNIPGYQICSMWQAAREVSGDFYDFIVLPGARFAITIADVSDKGIAAAMFMALSRTILRTMTIGKHSPHEAVERANDVILADARSEMFVTVFHGTLDPAQHTFSYVNAGHNPPLLYRAVSDDLTMLKGHGMAVGVLPNITLDEYQITLAPGDVLLMYTDGVTDAINSREEEFGDGRLADLVRLHANKSADELINEINRAVVEFVGDQPRFDDLTMIALKRTPLVPLIEPDSLTTFLKQKTQGEEDP